MVYETKRLIMRPFRDDDVLMSYDFIGDHENTKYMRAGRQSLEECAEFILAAKEDELVFALELKANGRMIGTAEIAPIDDEQATLGWVIHRDHWGRGICTEAAEMLLKLAFEKYGLRRVLAYCDSENIGSWHVMEKIGMRREGTFLQGREAYPYAPDRHANEYAYAITAEEYFSERSDHSARLRELLSIEYNCSPSDLTSSENILTVSKLQEGRRFYSAEKYFFHMATMGGNAVITADEQLHDFLRGFMKDRPGHWLFELPNLLPLEKELNRFGYTLTQTYHMFMPSHDVIPQKNYPVKWFYESEIHRFYGDERFPNAICCEFDPNRPDRIVVCAYDGDNIMGMAGCSEDAPHWQQIGIDVLPDYRSLGVGTYLVTLLKNEIIRRGDIPFYGTSLSNYHSWNIALNCGFRPAWLEIGCRRNGS